MLLKITCHSVLLSVTEKNDYNVENHSSFCSVIVSICAAG